MSSSRLKTKNNNNNNNSNSNAGAPVQPRLISTLSADEVARHAFNVFLFMGRHQLGARLIHRALTLNPKHPEALRCLSDILDNEGTERYSAIVLEYSLSPESGVALSDSDYKTLDDLRFMAKYNWGLVKHKHGKPITDLSDLEDRTQFDVDEAAYQEFIEPIITQAGSLEKAFQSCIVINGVLANILMHKTLPPEEANEEECCFPERFKTTPEYERWLKTATTEQLDVLEAHREDSLFNQDEEDEEGGDTSNNDDEDNIATNNKGAKALASAAVFMETMSVNTTTTTTATTTTTTTTTANETDKKQEETNNAVPATTTTTTVTATEEEAKGDAATTTTSTPATTSSAAL